MSEYVECVKSKSPLKRLERFFALRLSQIRKNSAAKRTKAHSRGPMRVAKQSDVVLILSDVFRKISGVSYGAVAHLA